MEKYSNAGYIKMITARITANFEFNTSALVKSRKFCV